MVNGPCATDAELTAFLRGQAALETLVARLEEAVPPLTNLRPDVPADLQSVVLRCLEKAPADHFPDAATLKEALASCACASP